jgi:hypothetical protein
MLTAVPKNWFSWDFWLRDPTGDAVGEVRLSSRRERGSVVLGGVMYPIRRKGLLGPFVMEAPDGSEVASAVKRSALRREFIFAGHDAEYVLKAVTAFRRKYAVFRGEYRIGSIVPGLWLRRRATVEFAEDLPLLRQAFLVWLTLLLWKRDYDAAASGS